MNESDLAKLRALTLLLDNAYEAYGLSLGSTERIKLGSNEGLIQLDFGNLWYRQHNPADLSQVPQIENVIVTSSVFSAARVNYFDCLDDAIEVVERWYEDAKVRAAQAG